MAHTLPPLPYSYTALEPWIDAKTMEIHHTKHHQTYIDTLNAAMADTPHAMEPIDRLLAQWNTLPEDKKTVVRNHGGGHSNHTLFWSILSPNPSSLSDGDFSVKIRDTFGSFEACKEQCTAAAVRHFGSGWAWLTLANDGLKIHTTSNQDSPILDGQTPLLGLDLWEHAYYLTYQNRRAGYLEALWHCVDWSAVEKRYDAAVSL